MSTTLGTSGPELEKAGMYSESTLAGTGLGTLQMECQGCIVLIPTPSSDPNDR